MNLIQGKQEFCHGIAQIACDVLNQITGREILFTESATPLDLSTSRLFEFVRSGQDDFKIALRCSPSLISGVAEAMLGRGIEGQEAFEAAEEFFRQVIGRFNTSKWKDAIGGEIELNVVKDPAWAADVELGIEINGIGENAAISIGLSPQLSSHVGSGQWNGHSTAPVTPNRANDECAHGNLELLLHVPLTVTLRFGERRLLLREILQLSSGAVIELDRLADDPVDLCLGDRVIARGQVVVVDGCYGLRVGEIRRGGTDMLNRGSAA